MPEVRKVLCPADFAPWSEGAMRYAAWLCKQLGAELTMLHVFEMPAYATVPEGAISVATASTERRKSSVST